MYNDNAWESVSVNGALYVDICQSGWHDSLNVLLEWAHPVEYPQQQKYTQHTEIYENTKVLPEEVSNIVIHYISVVRYLEVAIVERHEAEEVSADLREQ